MPKIKTKSGTKKRFKTTASGKVVMFPSCKGTTSKRSRKMKRSAKGPTIMSKQIVNRKKIHERKNLIGENMSRVKAGLVTKNKT